MSKFLISSVAAVGLFGAVQANAEPVQVRVSTADFDLSQSGDVMKLRSRVSAAIRSACTAGGDDARLGMGSCYYDAMAEAEAQIRARRDRAVTAPAIARN